MANSVTLKPVLAALILTLCVASATAQEAGEHTEKKPPPKPPAGSPVGEVLRLPAVAAWEKWVASYKGTNLTAWGEYLNTVEDKKCWEVAVGEILPDGKTHVWRQFCVPQDGGEIWVESNSSDPNADITYMPYGKSVEDCKPTEESEGSC